MAGEEIQFLRARQTALIILTGRRRSPVWRRRRICCVESEKETNITTFHPSRDTPVSLTAPNKLQVQVIVG